MAECAALEDEIKSLKKTLCAVARGGETVHASISGHAARIAACLNHPQQCVAETRYRPVHDLLDVGGNVKIPLDILALLVSEFDVNELHELETCLQIAIQNNQFDAVKFLLENGADFNLRSRHPCPSEARRISAITLLTRHSEAPLELLEKLASDELLNNVTMFYLPLHTAIEHGNVATALRLIELGADVNTRDGRGMLPIDYYGREHDIEEYDKAMFCSIVPSNSCDVFATACRILGREQRSGGGGGGETSLPMLRALVQRLLVPTSATVAIHATIHSDNRSVDMTLNEDVIVRPSRSFKAAYLTSILLVLLDCNIVSQPLVLAPYMHRSATEQDRAHAQAIDTVWQTYSQQPRVKSLLTLSIQRVRVSMKNLQDADFESVPVPEFLRGLLRYQHVAPAIFEAMQLWPEVL
jgi:hypothetical protein